MRPFCLLAALSLLTAVTTFAQQQPAIVGAIRWDAWHGQLGVPGQAVERSLAPAKWQDRLPFFATVRGDDDITINGTAPGVMDREIAYAHQAGIDYWAFVTYGENDSMSLAIKQYLASPHRDQVNFCLINEGARWKDPDFVRRAVRLISEPGYQRVLDGRPLFYLGFIDEKLIESYGGPGAFRALVDDFRHQVIANGSKQPYIVIMDHDPARGNGWRRDFGADALSSYAAQANAAGGTYADLTDYAEKFWERCLTQGAEVVPICMAGWDRRPRVERPVPWETWQKPGEGTEHFYERAKPDQLTDHVLRAIDWTRQHPAAAPAQTILIYAWNENDEGGWLVPTGGEGTSRIEALGKALRPSTR